MQSADGFSGICKKSQFIQTSFLTLGTAKTDANIVYSIKQTG